MKASCEIAIYHLGPVDLTDLAFIFADVSAARFEKFQLCTYSVVSWDTCSAPSNRHTKP